MQYVSATQSALVAVQFDFYSQATVAQMLLSLSPLTMNILVKAATGA
jgi:hypothetical protein